MSISVLLLCMNAKAVLVDVANRTKIDPEIAETIEGRYQDLHWEDIQQLSGRHFDLVISTDVFEHIPAWKAAFRDTAEYLGSGGYYYIQTPSNYASPNWPTWNIIMNRMAGCFGRNNPARHVRHELSCKQFADCATEIGLSPIIAAEDYVINNTVHCSFKPRTHCLFQRTQS